MKKYTLIFFLIILSSKAYSMSVKNLYELCKPYQSSGYKNFDQNAISCTFYLRGLMDQGYKNCEEFRGQFQRRKSMQEFSPQVKSQIILLHRLSDLIANEYVTKIDVVVNSFIKFAEANMVIWEYNSVAFHRGDIVGKINRCDLKK